MLAVISLGGSVIVPDKIDENFLSGFRSLIVNFVKKGNRAIIVCGGGRICRDYISTARKLITDADETAMDKLGVKVTEVNAELVKGIFTGYAYEMVHSDYNKKINFQHILVSAGFLPGTSTDYDAVMFAKKYGADRVINLSNIDCLYDKDPRKFKDAKPIERIGWRDFKKLIGGEWKAGLNIPFDPAASKKAEEFGIHVVILNGKNLSNLQNYLDGKKFNGTVIS